MLKIKFNINEFSIIFLRRFKGKNERKRISFSLYQLQRPFSCFSVSFLLQRPFLLFLVSATQHRKPLGFISRAYHRVSAWLPHILFGNIKIFPSTNFTSIDLIKDPSSTKFPQCNFPLSVTGCPEIKILCNTWCIVRGAILLT